MSSSEILEYRPTGDCGAQPELIAAAGELARSAIVSDKGLQRIVTAAARLYAERYQAGERSAPVTEGGAVSATDTLIFVTALLKSANLELFELGMWQSWSGSR
jgi:hypothetical protein